MRNLLLRKVSNPLTWKIKPTSLPMFRLTIPRQRISDWLIWITVACFIVVSLWLFFSFVSPALNGTTNFRIGADSAFYLWAAGLRHDNPYGADYDYRVKLIGLGNNLLGPLLIAATLRSNFLILCFNYVLFFLTVRYAARSRPINSALFTLLLILNPAVFVSLLTVNKEILAVLTTALLCYYIASGRQSKALLAAIVPISLLARWEHLLVVIFFLLVTREGIWNRHRVLTLLGVIIVLSAIYPLMAPSILETFRPEDLAGGNAIVKLMAMQSNGMYFAAVIPKIALNLFAGVVVLFNSRDPSDIYNSLVLPYSCIVNFVVTVWFAMCRKFRLRDDMLYFAALYAVVMALSPFAQTRYFLPVYMVLCLKITESLSSDSPQLEHLKLANSQPLL
jgi:hypothetical protein